jgi:hypothetical protein
MIRAMNKEHSINAQPPRCMGPYVEKIRNQEFGVISLVDLPHGCGQVFRHTHWSTDQQSRQLIVMITPKK